MLSLLTLLIIFLFTKVIYKAEVKNDENEDVKIYIGLAETPFKESEEIMVRLGLLFINLAKRKRIGLETRKGYISPENNAGVWHGAGVKAGFIETFSGKKTKRFWKPNVFEREYYSDILDEKIKNTFTMKADRQIHFAGGFDNYILNTPDRVLVSNYAIALKRRMETVQRMLQNPNNTKTVDEIKQEIEPFQRTKHRWVPREYTNRFYFDWKGVKRHMVYC